MLQAPATPQQTISAPQEIEIKIKTSQQYMEHLHEWLKEHAQPKGVEQHKEVYLDNPQTTFFFTKPSGEKDALNYLRVRWSNNEGSVCLKKWYEQDGKSTHCDEYETDVSNPDILLKLLEQLGYTHHTWVEKKRQKFLAGDYEIVIDEVKNLGTFVEVEMKKLVTDPKAALQELEDFLVETIGIKEYWVQTRGYVSHLRNPHLNFGVHKKR